MSVYSLRNEVSEMLDPDVPREAISRRVALLGELWSQADWPVRLPAGLTFLDSELKIVIRAVLSDLQKMTSSYDVMQKRFEWLHRAAFLGWLAAGMLKHLQSAVEASGRGDEISRKVNDLCSRVDDAETNSLIRLIASTALVEIELDSILQDIRGSDEASTLSRATAFTARDEFVTVGNGAAFDLIVDILAVTSDDCGQSRQALETIVRVEQLAQEAATLRWAVREGLRDQGYAEVPSQPLLIQTSRLVVAWSTTEHDAGIRLLTVLDMADVEARILLSGSPAPERESVHHDAANAPGETRKEMLAVSDSARGLGAAVREEFLRILPAEQLSFIAQRSNSLLAAWNSQESEPLVKYLAFLEVLDVELRNLLKALVSKLERAAGDSAIASQVSAAAPILCLACGAAVNATQFEAVIFHCFEQACTH